MMIWKVRDQRIYTFSALREYCYYHANHYQALQSMGIWLSYKGTKQVKPQTLAVQTQSVMRDAGIDAMYGVATLRHAAITFWRDQGISLDEVMERTGH